MIMVNDLISIINKSRIEDNSNTIISNFWENIDNESTLNNVDVVGLALELIKDAKRSIYIYSSKITSPELKVELENLRNKEIFIYALATGIENHRSTFTYGIMREKIDIDSSFIIVDPNSSNPRGMWFKGEFTSKSKNVPYVLLMDKSQVKESWAQFCYFYWKATGNELIFGKIRDTMSIKPGLLEIRPFLTSVFRTEALENKIQNENINEIWLKKDSPELIIKYQSDAETLIVELNDVLKEKIYFNDISNKNVKGSFNIPFTLVYTSNSSYIFCKDIGYKCNGNQIKDIKKAFSSWPWMFKSVSKIKDINGSIILKEDKWITQSPKKIQDTLIKPLGVVKTESLEEWQNPKDPVIDKKFTLARNINYQWTIEPPYRSNNSKVDKLYPRWDNFEKKFKEEVKKTLTEIEKANSKEQAFEKIKNIFIAKSTNWKDYNNLLTFYLETDWKHEDIIDTKKAVDKLGEIQSKIAGDIAYLNKKNIQPDKVVNESSEPIKESKKSDDVDDELDYYYNLPKKNGNLMGQIPENPLPRVGTIYSDGDKKYLVIKYINEIPAANRIKDRYRIKVVAEKSG
jgi:hypothetical protein